MNIKLTPARHWALFLLAIIGLVGFVASDQLGFDPRALAIGFLCGFAVALFLAVNAQVFVALDRHEKHLRRELERLERDE